MCFHLYGFLFLSVFKHNDLTINFQPIYDLIILSIHSFNTLFFKKKKAFATIWYSYFFFFYVKIFKYFLCVLFFIVLKFDNFEVKNANFYFCVYVLFIKLFLFNYVWQYFWFIMRFLYYFKNSMSIFSKYYFILWLFNILRKVNLTILTL